MAFFGGLNAGAILLASALSFLFGAVYYMVLSKPWREASGLDATGPAASPPPSTLLATFLAEMLMAWLFALLLRNLRAGGFAARGLDAAGLGVLLWGAFIFMPLIVNNMYQRAKRMLTVIDGGHWLGVMLIQAAVLAAMIN